MNAIMNGTQSWFCDICDKTNKIKSKSKHIIYNSYKHKQNYGIVVEEYEFIKPNNDEVKYIVNDTKKDCKRSIFYHSNLGVYMISNLKILRITKKLFEQLILGIWNSNLNFMD